jgi:hypothetical protein
MQGNSNYGIFGNTSNFSGASYGSFESSVQQLNPDITKSNIATFNLTTQSNGISLVSSSQITYANSGTYLINFLGQFAFVGGASNFNITVWYALNGTPITNSSYTFTTTSAQNAQILANLEDIVTISAGQYLQIFWWAGTTGITLTPTAAAINPTRPASPSANFNTFRIA